jgi:hypothetical protein
MSLGGGQTQTPVAGSNKYAEIMELMRRRNAMNNSTYTGGFNAYPVAAPSSGSSSAYDELLRLQALNNSNRFTAADRGNDALTSNPGWDALDDAQKAAYYAENPTMAALTRFGQNLFGYTTLGLLQKALDPTFVDRQESIALGINPNTGLSSGYGSGIDFAGPTGGYAVSVGGDAIDSVGSGEAAAAANAAATNAQAQADVQANTAADSARAYSAAIAEGLKGENQGGSYGREGGGLIGGYNAGVQAREAENSGGFYGREGGGVSGGVSDGGGRESGGNFGGDAYGGSYGFNKGGQVTMDRLRGPNPMGPDDGYGGLDSGEFVINAKSVGKYGIELMNAINAGKISKGKLRGLLEA